MAAKKLFGTSGIRGLVGYEVTCELALNVGKSLAYYLGNEGTVVLGYDTRTTNDMLDQAICAGLLESGVDVVKIGMVPTPLVGYATEKLDADAGIMLTASHNPSRYNGIKLWNKNGMAYTSSQEAKIEGGMKLVVRALLTAYAEGGAERRNVYLNGAEKLRPGAFSK